MIELLIRDGNPHRHAQRIDSLFRVRRARSAEIVSRACVEKCHQPLGDFLKRGPARSGEVGAGTGQFDPELTQCFRGDLKLRPAAKLTRSQEVEAEVGHRARGQVRIEPHAPFQIAHRDVGIAHEIAEFRAHSFRDRRPPEHVRGRGHREDAGRLVLQFSP